MRRKMLIPMLLALVAGTAVANAQGPLKIGGNDVYQVLITVGHVPWKCGVWSARTQDAHPLGPNIGLFFNQNGGFPVDSSFTILRSHHSGRSYATGGSVCTQICDFVGIPETEPILKDGQRIGHRLTWVFVDDDSPEGLPGSRIEFIQEVAVEGPVDGTETVDNTVIRETHYVRNVGSGQLRLGLRKMYDLAIGDSVAADSGPWFGDCRTPEAACDRSVNLTPEGAQDGIYPENIVINSAPVTAVCPGTVDPNETAACDGEPPYFVAATVGLPGDYSAPDLLQFNSWESVYTSCWIGDLEDAAECSVQGLNDGGTALSYYYGLSPLSAVVLGPGERRQFTQFFAMSQTGCPSVIRDGLDPSLDPYRGPY